VALLLGNAFARPAAILFDVDGTLLAIEADAAFAVFEKTYRQFMDSFPGRRRPARLRWRDTKLAVMTNGDLEQQTATLQAAGLGLHFRQVFASGDIGHIKPRPAPSLVSCAPLGVAPSRCACIGDSRDTDVRGSAEAGLMSTWLNRDGSRNAAVDVGFRVIHSLDELLDLMTG